MYLKRLGCPASARYEQNLLLGTRTRHLGSAQTIAPVFSLAFRPLSSHSTVFSVLPTSLLPIGYDPSELPLLRYSDDLRYSSWIELLMAKRRPLGLESSLICPDDGGTSRDST